MKVQQAWGPSSRRPFCLSRAGRTTSAITATIFDGPTATRYEYHLSMLAHCLSRWRHLGASSRPTSSKSQAGGHVDEVGKRLGFHLLHHPSAMRLNCNFADSQLGGHFLV